VPGVNERARERGAQGPFRCGTIADNEGHTYELEVVMATTPMPFLVNYKLGDTNHTLRFDMKWYGDGSLVLVVTARGPRSLGTSATLLPRRQRLASALPTLLALTSKMGESAKPEEK
jgi:hypothetical protein